jgi:hypothetical protein
MTLLSIIGLMMVAIGIGKRGSRLGGKQYLAILIISLLQVGIVVYHMYTMEMPPLR